MNRKDRFDPVKMKERRDYAAELFKKDPKTKTMDVLEAVQKKFGIGIDRGDIYVLRREVLNIPKARTAGHISLPEAKKRVKAQALKGYSMARLPVFIQQEAKKLAGHMSDLGITEIGIEVTSDKKEVRWRGQAPLGVQAL